MYIKHTVNIHLYY